MLPVIALLGRPNVGKSTLFNRLTASRDAIVDDRPGVTRDRLYGRGNISGKSFLVVDSGGVSFNKSGFDLDIMVQVEQLLEEANEVLFLVDARDGIHPHDEELARLLRKTGLNVTVLVNKSEGQERQLVTAEFQSLGLGNPLSISASRGDGVKAMIERLLQSYIIDDTPVDDTIPRVALVGRPNAGKSTLTNALLKQERVIVSDVPGTTRDSVSVLVEHKGRSYRMIDTAGVRRRAKVSEKIEKLSIIKTLQSIEHCNVAVILLDAHEGISAQDVNIVNMVQDAGRALVLAINKWDGLSRAEKTQIEHTLDLKFPFLHHVETLHLSAKYGTAVGNLLPMVQRAYDSAFYEFHTAKLNRFLAMAVEHTAPPMRHGRKIKIKFGHQAGKNPPVIILHGNQVDQLPKAYLRYLQGALADAYRLVGVTVRLIPRLEENPFEETKKPRVRQKAQSKTGANARRKKRK